MTVIAYIACAGSREIVVLRLAADGSCSIVQRMPAAGAVMPLALSPDRRTLYASLRTPPFSVASFAVAATGALVPIASAPLPDNMAYLATDGGGAFLLSASYSGGKLAVNRIERPGIVRAEPVALIEGVPNAHAILAAPDNRFVYATSLGSDSILAFRLDPGSGTLTTLDPARAARGAGPRHLAFAGGGGALYCINELDATVATYARDRESGALDLRQTVDCAPPGFTGRRWAADLALTPGGQYLFASERTSSTLSSFRVGDGGMLAPLDHVDTELQPRGIAIDPTGKFLLAAGQLSGAVSVYAIEASGTLASRVRIEVGDDPNWIVTLAVL